jgi:hypothetical protein
MEEPKLKNIEINKIKVDLDNPNQMTEAQFTALKENIGKYGYLVPIIVDKNFNIADGEHRYLAYKEMGMKEIPAYVLDIKDPDRRLLRQVMNKLKGEHDFEKDKDEFKILTEKLSVEDIKKLIGPVVDLDHYLEAIQLDDIKDEWIGMPAFDQKDLTAKFQILVSFKDEKAREDFGKAIGRKFTDRTRFIWYPQQKLDEVENLRY